MLSLVQGTLNSANLWSVKLLFQHGQTKIIEINGPFWSMANHPIEVYVNACDIFGKKTGRCCSDHRIHRMMQGSWRLAICNLGDQMWYLTLSDTLYIFRWIRNNNNDWSEGSINGWSDFQGFGTLSILICCATPYSNIQSISYLFHFGSAWINRL